MTGSTTWQVVVIGAGPGLGRSIAMRFAREGLNVALIARNAGRLAAIADEIRAVGVEVTLAEADAAEPLSIVSAIGQVAERGPIKVLVYNAAMPGGWLSETGLDTLRQASDVNLHTPILAVQAALGDLRQTSGTVLLTGGGYALRPSGEYGVISVGKAALRAAALALAQDVGQHGVKVRTVTIAGTIQPGTDFDPEPIADEFWQAHIDSAPDIERIYTGNADRPARAGLTKEQ